MLFAGCDVHQLWDSWLTIPSRCCRAHPNCSALAPWSLCAQLRRDTYSRLTPVQRLQVARHPNRPTLLDVALNITDKFVELHGDRAGLDDPAMVCGIGSIDGVTFMFMGHQKGRNTKVNRTFCSTYVCLLGLVVPNC
jgi:Acetyl co-enzyme A carboxylase carboxyltransferase alpha subunit